MLTPRTLEILKELLKQEAGFTILQIAENLNLSEKTVRNHLEEANGFLIAHDLKLLTTPGKGSQISGESLARNTALRDLQSADQKSTLYRSRERVFIILFRLLATGKTCYIRDFEEQLYISRSSLYKNLKDAENWLSRFKIGLVINRKKGISLMSGEKRNRLALVKLVSEIGLTDNALFPNDMNTLLQRFLAPDSPERRAILSILKRLEHTSGQVFVSDEIERLGLIFLVGIYRYTNGFNVFLRDEVRNRLQSTLWVKHLAGCLTEFNRYFQIDLPPDELYYYSGILLSSKFNPIDEEPIDQLTLNAQAIAAEFSALVLTHCDLNSPERFTEGLVKHLTAIFKKAQFIWECHNPIKEIVKIDFPNSYRLASKIIPIARNYTILDFPDDEIAYIAMHIMAELERSRKPLKALFTYDQTYSEIKYPLAMLENHISEIRITKTLQTKQIRPDHLEDVDIVLGTSVPDERISRPFYQIPPLPKEEDFRKLKTGILELYNRVNDRRIILLPIE